MPRKKKILVVEDDSGMSDFYCRILEAQGYEAQAVWSGEQALSCAKELGVSKPDLILLDIFIDGLHGYKVLEELNRDAGTRLIPVIVCSSEHAPSTEATALASGAKAFFRKPVPEETLLPKIAELLGTP